MSDKPAATLPAPSLQADLAERTRSKKCWCGCGSDIAGRVHFRPGHDARFVSLQVRALVIEGGYTGDIQEAINFRTLEVETYISKPLATKFYHACLAAWVKMNKTGVERVPRARAPYRTLLGRPVKIRVGRWTYDGRVAATTVNSKGREDRNSEVVAITYADAKGREHTVQVDNRAYANRWSFVATDASHLEETK